MNRIPLVKPPLDDEVKRRVIQALDSGMIAEGPAVRELESLWSGYTGASHALAVTNCTVGLELGLRALGVGPGDEVVVPAFTYPASAAAVRIVGAQCVLADIDPGTLVLDRRRMEAAITPRTKAVMPVSLFGCPVDPSLMDAARARGLKVIEDAACSIGAAWDGRRTGSLADVTVFSMHPRKSVTTGEGGMVTTSDPELARRVDAYRHFGMLPGPTGPRTVFATIGTNAKLSDLAAAAGIPQMRRFDAILEGRETLAREYDRLLEGVRGVTRAAVPPEATHARQSYCVLLDGRDHVWERMRAQGIEVQIGSFALHLQPAFIEDPGTRFEGPLETSARAFARSLVLPLHHDLTPDDQARVVHCLDSLVNGPGR
ncbi:MAG: DegT/DnrJ/EryC1/StrS family aminotransferase [Thermodesulfobacteriota bacterium]